jgi:hypothetical protein
MKKIKTYSYGVFILTHGRPDNVVTTPTLRRHGYNGQIYYVLDTRDKTIDKYKENFGDENVIIFNKDDVKGTFDIMDNQDDDRCVVYARNEVFNIAKKLGFDYFIVLDDDYTSFNFRFDKEYKYISSKKITNLESIFQSMIRYMDNTQIYTLCFSQGGDFIGGKTGGMAQAVKTKRKAMNLFILSTNRPFQFTGRINEDVNAYLRYGIIGKIMLTTTQVCLEQMTTQTNKGGLTDIYLASGTYVKSFYSVMCSPSSVKINLMGNKHRRLHHIIRWKNTVPKIIKQKYQK